MAKQYKIKRRKGRRGGTYRAAPHPIAVIATVIAIGALIYVGVIIYPPVYDFIMSIGSGEEVRAPEPEEPSLPQDVSEPEPPEISEPEPEPPKTVEKINAAYMPLAAAAGAAATEQFLAGLPDGINAVLLDVKDSQGKVLYQSKNERALRWEALSENPVDLEALAGTLASRNLHLVARMQTFSDPVCARGDREANAVKYQNSEMLWLDNFADRGGKPWSNPFAAPVRSYLTELASELAEMGASMVVLDGVRFPDDMTGSATYGGLEQGSTKTAALSALVSEVEEALRPLGARAAVSLSCTAVDHLYKDSRYGGNPLDFAGGNAVITILPEEISTGYLAEGVMVTRPSVDPAATVREVMAYVRGSTSREINLIPMLRGTTGGEIALTREQLGSQLAAAAEFSDEYILYSADGQYGG